MKINSRKITQYIVWLGLFTLIFGLNIHWRALDTSLYVATFETLSILIVYRVVVDFLFPRFHKNQKKYMLVSMGVIIILTGIYFAIDLSLFEIPPEKAEMRPPRKFSVFRILLINTFTFFIATSTSYMEHTQRLSESEKLLNREKIETELKLLKAQINPHFIFNALNNIYSLTYMQAKNAPDSVLKLSEMLRYVFYDCSKDRVPITSEVQYIENFIAFQQMKSEYAQNITLENNMVGNTIEIAPMLFVPFIENAFKYSRIEEDESAFVAMRINRCDKGLCFSIKNNFSKGYKPMPGSGMGIQNVKYRLDIIYPDKHELNITENEDSYSVELNIETA